MNQHPEVLLKSVFEQHLEKNNLHALRCSAEKWNAAEIAALIKSLAEPEAALLFRVLRRAKAAQVFESLSFKQQHQLVEALAVKQKRLAALLNNISPDNRAAFFEELPSKVKHRLLKLLNKDEQSSVLQLLAYPEDSIGRMMTTDYVAVKPHWTVQKALEHIRQFGLDSETINIIYVVDKDFRLIDDLRIRDFILAKPGAKISELMDHHYVALQADEDQETAIQAFKVYDRIALPVTDSRGLMMGIVTVDDVLDVAEEEATEDFHKFGSLQDSVLNPIEATVGFLYRKRITWLFVLVMVNVFSGAAIVQFEETIQATVALVFFLPLLIDSGGNAGSQSATIMLRALATGEAYLRDWFKLLLKEIPVAFLLGITMAAGVAAIAGVRAPEIIPVVALTMVCIVMVGSLVGLSLPFMFNRIGVDPATASAPLITSIADISGVLIYFSIAKWYLGI